MNRFFFISLLFIHSFSFANDYVSILDLSKTELANFVDTTVYAIDTASGDLNGDGLSDAAIVLHGYSPANVIATDDHYNPCMDSMDTSPRYLRVLFRDSLRGLELFNDYKSPL